MSGYNDPEYVVYKTERFNSGFNYHLINLDSMSFQITRRIRPLSEKFGIGIYFDENNPRFMSSEEVAEILAKVQVKEKMEQQQAEQEKECREKANDLTVSFCFADSYSLWQRDANENLNGLIR